MSKKTKRAIVHVYSSFNNTIITATDITGAETITSLSGGMVVRSGREKSSPYAAMQMAGKVARELKSKGFREVDVKMRAPGGTKGRSTGPGAKSVVRSLSRNGVNVRKVEDVTPTGHGHMRKKGGKRGRRV